MNTGLLPSLKLLEPAQAQQLIKILGAIEPTATQLYEKKKIGKLIRILQQHTPM